MNTKIHAVLLALFSLITLQAIADDQFIDFEFEGKNLQLKQLVGVNIDKSPLPLPLYILKYPEYNLMGIVNEKEVILPLKFSDIRIDGNSAMFDWEPLWVITLVSKKPVFAEDIEKLVAVLRKHWHGFVIIAENSMGTSLFGNNGVELVHNTLERLRVKEGTTGRMSGNDKLLVTTEGKEVLMCIDAPADPRLSQYDDFYQPTNNNLYTNDWMVKKNGKVGLFNDEYGELVPPLYDNLYRSWGGITVELGGKEGLYDEKGKKIFDPVYKDIQVAYPNNTDTNYYALTTPTGALTIRSNKGEILVPAGKIDRVSFISGEDGLYCHVYKNGKMGILNLKAKRLVIPPIYDANDWWFGNGSWPNRKIGLTRYTQQGVTIEIWTISGTKLGSKSFSRSAKASMKRYIESQLNIATYWSH